ncbi:MAG: PKD domain-containing protein [Crocinitomicaceae bacterium]|nr:PKD domain-containing protein [Crocinitomicaceae bacterium]
MKKLAILFLTFGVISFEGLYAQVTAGDCSSAINICSDAGFAVDPSGFGAVDELGDGFTTGLISNPSTNPNIVAATGLPNAGCLLSGELNSTWMIINIATDGVLEFSMGTGGTFNCFDWIMWSYDPATTCGDIIGDAHPPVACNWNGACNGITGMAGGPLGTALPAGADQSDFEDAMNVSCGDQYIICFSNFSSAVTTVPLNFFGTASISCTTFIPITVNDTTICPGSCATLTAEGGDTYTWAFSPDLSATDVATVDACPPAVPGVYTYDVTGTGACGTGTATATVTVLDGADPLCSCTITDFSTLISACDPATGAYGASGSISFIGAPTTGTLIVEDCDGNQQSFTPPFTSPTVYDLTGLDPDGGPCDISVYFSDDPSCTQTIPYTAPFCPCNIDLFTANINPCDPFTDTYMLDGTVEFTSPPTSGTLIIEVDNGTTVYDTIITLPFASPETWSISGIPSDGAASTVTVYFTDDAGCTNSIAYTAPVSCLCPADIGSFTANLIGDSPNDYVLCFGDAIDIVSNDDYTLPDDVSDPLITYDPGISWLVYSCPPSVGLVPSVDPLEDVALDPCLETIISTEDLYDLNDMSFIGAFPPGTFTDNIVYFVPITMYSIVDGFYSASNSILPCYELGPTFEVQYLPEFTYNLVEDCDGTLTVTVNGGLAEIDGSLLTGSGLIPASAVFDVDAAPHGGDIELSGLVGGDLYSFDVTDANGCPYTVSGGPFIMDDDPSFSYVDGLTYCLTGTDPIAAITGLAGGTFSYIVASGGPTLDLNTATGNVNLAGSDAGVYDITYSTAGAPGSTCPKMLTLTMTINDILTTDFEFDVYCLNDADPMPDFDVDEDGVDDGSGGIFSFVPAGLSIDPTTGLVDLDASTPGTYTITNTIDIPGCAISTFDAPITIYELPDATISSDATICPGDPLPNLIVDLTAGTASWDITYDHDGVATTETAAATPHTIVPTGLGTFTLVSVVDGNGCTNTLTGSVTIDTHPVPVLTTPASLEVCDGDDLTVPVFVSDPPATGYDWTNVTGTDIGFGLAGAGGIGTFTATSGMDVDFDVTVSVTPFADYGGGVVCYGTPDDFVITVNPIPVVTFTGDPLIGCEPLIVNFTNTTAVPGVDCEWSFGDGTTATGCLGASHTYSAGSYDVSLTLTSADGCTGTATVADYVNALPVPIAAFTYAPHDLDINNTEVEFTNESILADEFAWDFGDESVISPEVNPTHLYPDVPGTYLVELIASNAGGLCSDTAYAFIEVEDIILFYVPNVFTPDGDEFNETFQPVFTAGYDPFDFHLMIFNRWGELIFESFDASKGWDGTYGDRGLVQDGVYVWKIEFKETMSDKRHYRTGHVTVLK